MSIHAEIFTIESDGSETLHVLVKHSGLSRYETIGMAMLPTGGAEPTRYVEFGRTLIEAYRAAQDASAAYERWLQERGGADA